VSDPVFADIFNLGGVGNYSGVEVGELTSLGISAVYRSVALISETLASLPLHTFVNTADGRQRSKSFLDNPSGVTGHLTSFEFWEMSFCHILLHGTCYWMHLFNTNEQVVGLIPIHPLCVVPRWNPEVPGGKSFDATLVTGQSVSFDATTMTQVMGKSLDGLKGLSVVSLARNSFGIAVAGDRAAGKMFNSGAMISGLVTPEEELAQGEAKQIKKDLNNSISGWENAGSIAVINRKLKFQQWTMSLIDAQFLESRQFQVEEIARWFGIPPFALMQTEKQTSWGTGIESQQRGLGRTVLLPWAKRVEQRASGLLVPNKFVEWDFAGLERATPVEEIRLILEQFKAGLITKNEARKLRGLGTVEGGDSFIPEEETSLPVPTADTEEVTQ
jgi:HK97 family phage portal protein